MRWISGLAVLCTALFSVNSAASVAPATSSQDLGSVAVGSSSSPLTFQVTGLSATPSFAPHSGTEFSLVQTSCTNTTPISCTVKVKFTPLFPGLRQDAIELLGPNGTLLELTLLHGIGLGPEALLRPGVLNNFAGDSNFGYSGDGGPATSATLSNPQGVAVDNAGNVYVSDSLAQVVRKIDTAGNITTVAGGGSGPGLGDGGPATSAVLNVPSGLALDGAGNLYIADAQNNLVRRVDALTQTITTVAGNGATSGNPATNLGDGGPATSAILFNPVDVALDGAGNLYIADQYDYLIRRVDAVTGVITTVAGGGTNGGLDGLGDGGTATSATLGAPGAIALDAAGNLYIADTWFAVIRKVSGGIITVAAGTVGQGSFNEPTGLRADAAGNIYVSDTNNNVLWEVNGAGLMFVLAGVPGQFGYNGDGVLASQAQLWTPAGIALDASGNIYIADQGNSLVRKVVPGPAALNFDTTAVGSISAPQTVEVDNIGNQPLSFTAFGVTGNFVQQSGAGTNCGAALTIPAASSCLAAIAFAPQAPGSLNGVLSWQTIGQPAAATLALSGTATGSSGNSDPAVSANTLIFPTQAAGTSSAPQTITITDPGAAPLSAPAYSISGSNAADFSAVACQNSIAPNGSCTVAVTFTPASVGSRNATLTLTETNTATNAPFSQSVFLSGEGSTTQALISPATLSFNNTGVNALPMTETVTLSNPNAVAAGIFSIATSRPDLFNIGSNCPVSLPALSSCTVSVSFTPTASSVSPAALTITFSSGATESVTLTTSNPVVTLTGPAGSLGPQTRNLRSLPVAYALQNLGSAAMAVNAISIGGTNASDFQQVNNCGTSVAAGQGCTIWLTYLPTGNSPASSSATIVVTDSAPGSPHSIAVAGTATGLSQALIDFDTPSPGATVSGTIPLSGWAISNNGPITAVTLAVDGVSLGSAAYGGSRPDVCAVFPGRASCPNVGWSSSLNTTKLADGAHTLTLTASTSSAKTTTALPFTVANWARGINKTTIIDIDSPNAAAILSGTSVFSGWVVDNASSISSVSLSVDGVPLTTAHYGSARPDVCAVFPGRSGCPNVGWNASIDTRQFSNGQHTLAVTARTANGTTATVAASFRVGNATPSGLITCIDSPAATVARGILSAAGWAIDTNTAITSVTLSVDGVPQGTASTVARPDVCAAFGNQPGCPNVGWAGRIDTTTFADGAHSLGLLVQTADGHELSVSKPFTVSNAAPAGKTTLVNIDAPSPSSGPLAGAVRFAGWAIDQVTAIATVEIAIDGVPVTFLQPSLSRPDVCAAFPAAVGCPLLGWAASFDTSSLPDGTHLLQVTATSQQGMRATRTVSFVTSNAAAAAAKGQYIVMDYPQPGAVISGAVSLSGWAVNRTGNVQQVVVTVDGVTAGTAIYGTSRPDVCAVLESTSCPNVGWTYVLDTTWLSNGVHTLRATEYADNGCTTVSRSIVVSNAPTSLLIDVDTPVVNHTFGNTIGLSGWVIDNQNAVSAVTVAVDGLPIGSANYGSSRPDVCAVFPGRSGCPNVGWSFSLDTTAFWNGPHTLQISAISTANVRSTVSLPFNSSN